MDVIGHVLGSGELYISKCNCPSPQRDPGNGGSFPSAFQHRWLILYCRVGVEESLFHRGCALQTAAKPAADSFMDGSEGSLETKTN